MIKILIPPKFFPEKEYIIDVMLTNFLGLDYEIVPGKDENYLIKLQNGNQLLLQDAFFNSFTEDEGYLRRGNIPDKIALINSEFSSEDNIPVIFGNGSLKVSQSQIHCGIDIFASAFFMLSRWEEHCIKERDQYGNFPTNLALLQRNKLSYRPIVNEYVELLWNMLVFLGYDGERKSMKYSVKLTHDIDNFARFDSISKYLKAISGDLILRKNPGLMLKTTFEFIKVRKGKMQDPYDTFDFFMDVSEACGLKSHFYFIPGVIPEKDVRYNINDGRVVNMIRKIIRRGHIAGVHGTYSGFNNPAQFKNELERLKNIHPDISEGRQHYLRFLNPVTWQIWEDAGLKYDSSIGYEYDCGFRAGVCYEYPVFNILSRKKLNLIEQPLIFMEGSMHDKYPNETDFLNKLMDLVKAVKKYNGTFVFLWHNSNIHTFEWKSLGSKYAQIVKSIL